MLCSLFVLFDIIQLIKKTFEFLTDVIRENLNIS